MKQYFGAGRLAVGYHGKSILQDIAFEMEKGSVLTLIGPNGAGKSTILKTLTRHLQPLGGSIWIGGQAMDEWPNKALSREIAVVLTDRIRPELMTCAEIVAMGRYPYTNLFGRLTDKDMRAVKHAMHRVHALDLMGRDFSTLSDGQKQRVLLARAICQETNIIVLDEPTAYLDIRHKVELLDILRTMTKEKNAAIIMSLHEIDLAMKISDYLMLVKNDGSTIFGRQEDVVSNCSVEELYGMERGSYNPLLGSVELTRPAGEAQLFVVAGNGRGIPFYRALQKRQIPFATGILYENDVDYQVAQALSSSVIAAPAFHMMGEAQFLSALAVMEKCEAVVDAGTPVGDLNKMNGRLIEAARERDIPVLTRLP